MRRNLHLGTWLLAGAFTGLIASILSLAPTVGWLSSLALLAGSIAYAMMATNLLLASRLPALEGMFGPLDRVYIAHRRIGTSLVAVLGLHLVLIPVASVVDRGKSILNTLNATVPLGGLGALLLVGSIALALNPKVPYHRWQRLHMATALAFLVLTAHMLSGASQWASIATPAGGMLMGFSVLGLASLIARLVDKARGGVRYAVVETVQRERAVEIVMQPEGQREIAPQRPGQFIFLTATAGGAREAHPFTLTSAAGDGRISVLIRPSGDWTDEAQTSLAIADRVRVDGPFGAFTPPVHADAPRHQVWVAGGAGITPFLSVLRTAERTSDSAGSDALPGGEVELVVAARASSDVPCWDELSAYARKMPWLTITPAFSAEGDRLDSEAIDRLVARTPEGAAWYLCGPSGLTTMLEHKLKQDSGNRRRVHREFYEWRTATRKAR